MAKYLNNNLPLLHNFTPLINHCIHCHWTHAKVLRNTSTKQATARVFFHGNEMYYPEMLFRCLRPRMFLAYVSCIENAPLESGKRIAFAGFGRSHYKSREVSEALKTLQRAMLLYLLYPATSTELPILPDQRKYPRLQFLDTGLLNYSVGLMNDFFTLENLHSLYRDIVVEHITGQELIALCTDIQAKPGFWVRENPQANAEVDYIIRYKNSVTPIEVKSGATGSLRSLHQFMDACNHSMAVRLYAGELKITPCATIKGKKFTLLNLPYFFASKISEYLDWAFKG